MIGSGIAFELARRGVPVTLVERGRIGGEASWASAGIVSLPSRPWMKPERVELGRISLERYPALVAELEERTGFAIDYRRPGEWVIAVDEEHAEAERAVATWQRGMGLNVEDVPPALARKTEPALPESLLAAWFHPNVGSLSVYRLTQALATAARQLGATVLEETPVGGLLREGNRVSRRAIAGSRHPCRYDRAGDRRLDAAARRFPRRDTAHQTGQGAVDRVC